MSRSAKLVLVVLLVAAMAAAGAFLVGGGDPPPAHLDPTGTTTEATSTPIVPETPRSAPEIGVREAVAQRSTPQPTPPGIDPELYAEMAGFRGRVLHHDRNPAANTGLKLFRVDLQGIFGEASDVMAAVQVAPDVDGGSGQTDSQGEFLISGVWPRGLYALHAGIGTDNPTLSIIERTPASREVVDLGDIVLNDGAIVTGTVVDDDGAPIAGALVRAADLPMQIMQMVPLERFDPEGAMIIQERNTKMVVEMPPWVLDRFEQLPLPTVKTGADGAFRLTGILPGNTVVVATARQHKSLVKPGVKLEAGEQRDLGELRLDAGEEVYGKVTNTAGQPIAGAEVLVGQGGAVGEVYFASRVGPTDQNGEFAAEGYRAGKVVAAARAKPSDPWTITEPQPTVRDLNVVLPTQYSLTVRLRSAIGEPLGEPEFKLITGRLGDGAMVFARFGFSTPIALDDRLEKLDDGSYRIDDLRTGKYVLVVRCAGHALTSTGFELTGNAVQNIALAADAGLAVRVLSDDDQPVRGAQVYAEIRGEARNKSFGDMPVPLGATGADGLVAQAGIPAGEVRLSARHPAWGWTHGKARVPATEEIVLTFDKPGILEGILTDAGQIPEVGKWTVIANKTEYRGERAMPEMPRMVVPDAEGRFAIRGMQPGTYELQVMESFKDLVSPGRFMQKMMMSSRMYFGQDNNEVAIGAGQTAHVTLDAQGGPQVVDGPSAQFTGTVMIDGVPATGMILNGWGNANRVNAEVDAAGRFDLGQVGTGHLYLRLIDSNSEEFLNRSSMWSHSYQIEANKNLDIDISIQTASLAGIVFDPAGGPAQAAQLQIHGQVAGSEGNTGSADFNLVTDESGRFRVDRLPAGVYSVRAEHDQLGIGSTSVKVTSGVAEASIRLQRALVVKGRVDMSVFAEKPKHIWLQLEPQESEDLTQPWSQVDEAGNFEFDDLVAGRYKFLAWINVGNQHDQWFGETIEVTTQDLSGLVVRLSKKADQQNK